MFSIAESYPGVDDREVLARAVRDQRWLVTFDRDYGELLFARGYPPPPAVVLLRVPSYRPEDPAQWVIQLMNDIETYREKFTVFSGDTTRSRPFLRQLSLRRE